ncbi:NFX1-type zinc finger-containing protein 1 [Neolecta irregularis DAH-3]|uniref:NFX1-type zinc finger-containing protein 1 n=1 Tax=Neolecta irregularis (strain DAH-3) TaxID=1198029 RepID=A0A1U7LSF4_NEOID|nr:NFX1-type zinc finger-containing protein 1 [Neolecta irregularis DAH-3]|eukprot:OLL25606.1 NFX1-type zinc finger-containing protein 1 [Neolecta irregularis DAH-3]
MSASQVREFVSSALALLDAPDHHEEKMELVDSMGTPGAQGLERILEIIEMPISAEKISVALFRTKDLEFESVVLSFLKILVHEELLKRTVVFQLGNLYSSIYGESGARAVPFLEKLTSALSHYTSTNSKSPIAHEALDLLVSFLLQIVKRNSGAKFQDSFAEHISVFIGIQIMLLDLRATTTSTRLHSNLKILNRMVSNGQEMLRLSQKLAEQESKFVTPTGTILAIASLVDLPGNLSDAGPRHDNDLVGINQINILPTRSEILSVREAYMPSMLSNSDHFLQDGMSRLYDIQFRLLREDMVGPLKEAVAGAVHDIRHSVKIVKKHRGSENSLLFHEFRDVRINGVRFHKSLGMTFEISFASPVNSNKTASKKFWERTRSLSNGNLMCLILNDSDKTPDTEVIFCSVTFKDIKKLISSPDRCTVSIRLLSSGTRCEYDEMLLLRILTNQLDAYRQQCVVEYPGILYESYRPFLECLQNRHPEEAPFYDYLCGLNVRGVGKMVEVPPPFYAREKILEFDIAKISGSRESLMAPSSSRDITFLQLLKTHTTLDKEQQMAVLSAVRQELCIIQGPPGTGKSFVGVAIVSLLLSVKKEIGGGPIICVCFTNHALDQFLEHLLNRGIEKIGRIGGSSKSERLMPYNLRNLVQDVRSPATGRRKIWKTMRKIEKSVAAVEHKAKSLQSGHISWEAISDYLSVEFPHLFYQLAHPLDGDGFQIQNATNAFDFWIKGADIQVYEQPLSPIGPKTTTLKKKEPRQSNFFDIFNNLDVTEYSIQDKELDIENLSIQDSPFLPKIPEYVGFNRPIEQLMLVDDIWETSRMERQRLVDTWKVELEDEWQTDLQQANDELKKHQSQLSELRDEANRSCLSKLDVIGLTTNGMARYTTLVNSLRSKIIICEEAGEVLEAHTLTSFCPSIEHAILIGDHQQLRPKVNNFNLSLESRQGKSLRLDESLFERLCNKKWNDEDNGRPLEFPTTTLRVQRRMRPEISQLIRNTLYPDLQDDPRTFDYPDVSGMRYNLEWMSHESPEGGSDQNGQTDRSHYNKFEVKIIGALVQHLLRQFKYSMNDIAVLTPYVGQLLALREELGSIYTIAINDRDQVLVNEAQDRMRDLTTETLNARDDSPDEVERKISADKCSALTQLRLATVDNFQGEEAKVVLVSLVRSNPNGNIGFLKSFNRVNVLLSRAMHGMYIVGNVNLARKSDFWASIIRQLEMRNRIQKGFHLACPRHLECITIAEKPEDFYLKAPEGGCNLPCGGKLPCGHACTLKCHDEALHSKTACFEACLKLHKPCGHPCMQRCSDACGKCSKIVDSVQLPCGHWIQSPECWMTWTLDSVTCREVVEKKVPGCQHVIQTECFRDTNSSSFNCFELCGSTLPCGHSIATLPVLHDNICIAKSPVVAFTDHANIPVLKIAI